MAKDRGSNPISASRSHEPPVEAPRSQPPQSGHERTSSTQQSSQQQVASSGTTNGNTNNSSQQQNQAKYKKVFVQRDYSQGTGVRFQTTFPAELEGYIDPESFQYLINNINTMYGHGESMSGRAFCESCCACLSAYFLYLCVEPYYDKCARKVADFIEEQNDLRWRRRGLLVTDPLERGLRVIEITIFLDKVLN